MKSLTDSRRLTGANLFWDRPSAIIDVLIDGPQKPVLKAWESAAEKWLDAVGYPDEKTCFRLFDGGASLLISAPIDVLYSMCELNEVAWASAKAACGAGEMPDPLEEIPRLTLLFDEERNPALLALQFAAKEHGAPFLWDDDTVSLGYGKTARLWRPDALPAPEELNWSDFGTVPVALVTGTNGKSTTVRMTASIMTAAGYRAGLTSTDFIRVGDRIIDRGDYSGTGGARTLLRQADIEIAVLEVARGGLLRRGLGIESADVAVVTNVAADHLGEYGINSVRELIPVKLMVRKALDNDAPLVLNADDDGLVEFAGALDQRIVWFSLDPDNGQVKNARTRGETACWLEEGWLVTAQSGKKRQIAPVAEIPAAMAGVARYNIRNALAAACVALALNIDDASIRKGLAAFRGDEYDNPGRGNWFERRVDGGLIRILIDFAHNEHGMRALAESVRQVQAERVILLIGQAGDRSDQDIIDLLHAACSVNPDQLLVTELTGYERGRKAYEVPELIRQEAIRLGIPASAIEIFPGPADATASALSRAVPGDLLVLLALTQRSEALSMVHKFLGDDNDSRG
jgi:UDP-N-acetylmuramyl tripeptide synthase